MQEKVSQNHCQLTVSPFLPGSGTPLLSYSFFTFKVSPDGYGGRLCFDFPFLPKVAQKTSAQWASPLAWHFRLDATKVYWESEPVL